MQPLACAATAVDAPAKVNLALHVVGRRDDGYHLLDTLVAFAEDAADALTIAPAEGDEDELTIEGPFGGGLSASHDNLVLRAARFARGRLAADGLVLPPLAIRLDKRLPVAAGIGGGSADAAALLRAILAAAPREAAAQLCDCAVLGADVPMCLDARPARVTGIGEAVRPCPLPRLSMLLVNPGVASSTPEVFRRLERRDNPPMPPLPEGGFASAGDVLAYLRETRNDLEAPARAALPAIDVVRAELAACGARLVRMSGSGATVFGLFDDDRGAASARVSLAAARPEWWLSGAEPSSAALPRREPR